MGNDSPGRMRREGREAFEAGADPKDFCPYDSNLSPFRYSNWMEGWNEEEREYKLNQKQMDADDDLHNEIMSELITEDVSGLVMLLIKRGVF